jgi:hypothetical protein
MNKPRIALVALALTLATSLVPSLAAADTLGSGPNAAPTISGTMVGTLTSPQTYWYQVAGDGSSPLGITMDYQATDGSHPSGVYFNVDWSTADGAPNADWPGLFRYGRSSNYNLPVETQYWTRSTSARTTYYVEVVDNSGFPITYALASTGGAFPPPSLSFTPSTGGTAPAPAATPPVASPAPSVPATPAPVTTTNTATDRSGLILDPTVTVSGVYSTINVHIDSSSTNAIPIYRIVVTPPDDAVVDAVVPSQTRPENGIAWYLSQLVSQGSPLSSYMVRIYGPANGTVVEADWATSNDKGALTVTITGAPNPAPVGS